MRWSCRRPQCRRSSRRPPARACAHIFELVLEFDLLGDGYAVLRHARRAERLFDEGITSFGTKRDPHRMRKDLDPAQHFVARFARIFSSFAAMGFSPAFDVSLTAMREPSRLLSLCDGDLVKRWRSCSGSPVALFQGATKISLQRGQDPNITIAEQKGQVHAASHDLYNAILPLLHAREEPSKAQGRGVRRNRCKRPPACAKR